MGVSFKTTGGGVSVGSGSGTAGRVARFTNATTLSDTNIIATGTLNHIPTGSLTFGAGSAPDLSIYRNSAGNLIVGAGATGTSNLLQIGTSGILLRAGAAVIWSSTTDPAGAEAARLDRHSDGNLAFRDSGASSLLQIGSSGVLLRSTMGVSWSQNTDPHAAVPDISIRRQAAGNLLAVDSGGSGLIQIGSSGILLGSNRGIHWSTTPDPTGPNNVSITASSDAVSISGTIRGESEAFNELAFAYSGAATSGFGWYGSGGISVVYDAGTGIAAIYNGGILLSSTGQYRFNNTTVGSGTQDTSLARVSAGNIRVSDTGTTNILQIGTSGLLLGNARDIKWGTGDNPAGTAIAGMFNVASGVIATTDGTRNLGATLSTVFARRAVLSDYVGFSHLSEQYHFYDPNGADRDILLVTNPIFGHSYVVKNFGPSFVLTVKDAAQATQALLTSGDASTFVYDGATWLSL